MKTNIHIYERTYKGSETVLKLLAEIKNANFRFFVGDEFTFINSEKHESIIVDSVNASLINGEFIHNVIGKSRFRE